MTEEKITWDQYRQKPKVIERVKRIAKGILETDRSGIGSMDSAMARAWDSVRQAFSYEHGIPEQLKPKPKALRKSSDYFNQGKMDETKDIDGILKAAERGDTEPEGKGKIWLPPSAR